MSVVFPHAFKNEHIQHLFDDAYGSRIPPGIETNLTQVLFGQVVTARALADPVLERQQGFGQRYHGFYRGIQEVETETLGCFSSNAREFTELQDNFFKGRWQSVQLTTR